MRSHQIGTFVLTLLVLVIVVGSVVAYQRSQPDVTIDGPGTRVETNTTSGETTVDAPFARVEKNADGTRVEAPGVKIQIPAKEAND